MSCLFRAFSIAGLLISFANAAGADLRIAGQGLQRRVQILAEGEIVAESPEEGLWSVACDWREQWPADWRHAGPAELLEVGEWTILRGEL